MKACSRKRDLFFSFLWISIYILFYLFSSAFGKWQTFFSPFSRLLLCGLLGCWICYSKTAKKYGLCRICGALKGYLYFIPLIVITTANLWWGLSLKSHGFFGFLYIQSMLCTGFLEEVLFRGLLFQALRRWNLILAFGLSSLSFSILHLLNLFTGRDLAGTLIQIFYSFSLGFLYASVFYKTGSLLPCIFSHSLFNAFGIFTGQNPVDSQTVLFLIFSLSLWYGFYLLIEARLPSSEALQPGHHRQTENPPVI